MLISPSPTNPVADELLRGPWTRRTPPKHRLGRSHQLLDPGKSAKEKNKIACSVSHNAGAHGDPPTVERGASRLATCTRLRQRPTSAPARHPRPCHAADLPPPERACLPPAPGRPVALPGGVRAARAFCWLRVVGGCVGTGSVCGAWALAASVRWRVCWPRRQLVGRGGGVPRCLPVISPVRAAAADRLLAQRSSSFLVTPFLARDAVAVFFC